MQTILSSEPTNTSGVDSQKEASSSFVSSLGGKMSSHTTKKEVNIVRLIESLYLFLVFALPLFLVPLTFDAFNLNKTYLVVLISFLGLILFFTNAVLHKRLIVLNLRAYLPIALLLVGGILSTVLSTNQDISLFGMNRDYQASLMFLVSLAVIAFVSSNIKFNLNRLVKAFAAGATLSTGVSFLALHRVSLPGIGTVPVNFTVTDGTNTLMAIQVVALLVAMYYLGNLPKDNKMRDAIFFGATMVINAVYLLIGMNVYALAIVLVGVIYLLVSPNVDLKGNKKAFMPVLVTTVVLSFIYYFPATRGMLNITDYVNSPRLSVEQSWLVSVQALRDYATTGSGLGTFLFDFSRYRPESLNASPYWQVRFMRPFNDIFLWLATAGLSGLVAYIAFWFLSIKQVFALQYKGKSDYALALLVISVFAALMLLGSSLILYTFLFMLLGIVAQRRYRESGTQSVGFAVLGIIISAGILGYLSFGAYKVYAAQYYFRQSLLTTDGGARYTLQRKAIAADPTESMYYRYAVMTNLALAQNISKIQNPGEAEIKQIEALINQAMIDSAEITTNRNPLDVANWETRGLVYSSLIGLAPNAPQVVAAAYTQAVALENSNPKLWVDLGGIYYRQKDYLNAVTAFVKAISYKNDYANAHYNLAYALKDAGDYENAVVQLQVVKRLLVSNSPELSKVDSEIADFTKLAEDAKTKREAAQQQLQQQVQEQLSDKVKEPEQVAEDQKKDETLVGPQESGEYQLNPNDEITIPDATGEGSSNPDQMQKAPAADGSNPDQTQGQTEAPIAQPAGQ